MSNPKLLLTKTEFQLMRATRKLRLVKKKRLFHMFNRFIGTQCWWQPGWWTTDLRTVK